MKCCAIGVNRFGAVFVDPFSVTDPIVSLLTDNKEGLSNTSLRCGPLCGVWGNEPWLCVQAGFNVVAAMDHWNKAVDVYRQNFAHPCHVQDLSAEQDTCALIQRYAPDVLLGGPPCQDFSSAGKRDVTLGARI